MLGVDDDELAAELLGHFLPPLHRQTRRADHHDPACPLPQQQFQSDQTGLDRLAQAHVVGQQQIHPGRRQGAGDRLQLVVLDGDTGPERGLQGADVRAGHRTPPHRIQERRQARRVVETTGRIGQRTLRQHPRVGLDLPNHRQGLVEAVVLDRLQVDQRRRHRHVGGSSGRVVRVRRGDVADDPPQPTHLHHRARHQLVRAEASHPVPRPAGHVEFGR